MLSQATIKTGLKNSLDIAVIEQAKDVYFDAILKLITNLKIPDFYAKDNEDYMIDNTLVIQEQPDNVNFYTSVEENAVIFEMDNLSC